MGKENGSYSAHTLLQYRKQQCCGGGSCGVTDTDACKKPKSAQGMRSEVGGEPWRTAREDKSPAIELEKACNESWGSVSNVARVGR